MALPLKVRLYDDTILRRKCDSVIKVDSAERMLIQSMIHTMHSHKGIGLAAPQVGIARQMLVADVDDGRGPIALVNPKIITTKGEAEMEEGCLSIPEVHIKVIRPAEVVVHFTNENNEEMEGRFTELMARVVLHEMDHLNGKLILDYATDDELQKYKSKIEEIKRMSKG
ncbi:MAG: peptide deformylase [Candidatus Omnitrophota bacterium]|jgi:peptide deformylase